MRELICFYQSEPTKAFDAQLCRRCKLSITQHELLLTIWRCQHPAEADGDSARLACLLHNSSSMLDVCHLTGSKEGSHRANETSTFTNSVLLTNEVYEPGQSSSFLSLAVAAESATVLQFIMPVSMLTLQPASCGHHANSRENSCMRWHAQAKSPQIQAFCQPGHKRHLLVCSPASTCSTPVRQTKVQAFPNLAFPDISPEVLVSPFQFCNVAISVLWAPIIIAPRSKITEAVAKSRWSIIIPSIAFLYFFLAATVIDSPDLADVLQKSKFLFTDGAADPKNMAKLLSSPAYAAQDWVHVLIWDYGAGRLIYLDALKKGVPIRPSLLVTFIAGPVGLLVHELTCAIYKGNQSETEPAP